MTAAFFIFALAVLVFTGQPLGGHVDSGVASFVSVSCIGWDVMFFTALFRKGKT